MNYEAYPFVGGKQGVIQKVIALSVIENNVYNLALLDFDPVTQVYTDKSVTDNGDMPRSWQLL